MMLKIFIFVIYGLLISPGAWAVCTLARGTPAQVTIAPQLISISADAPVDTSTPIAQYDSPLLGHDVGYDDCTVGTEYGKRTVNLSGQDGSTNIFQTNIPGIGIKLLWNNGSAFGDFPSTYFLTFDGGEQKGTFDFPAQSFYRIQFFKTSNNLHLSNSLTGDAILPPGQIGYNYLLTADPGAYVMSLAIGEMKIVSTTACTADSAKNIDFNNVTPTLLQGGVTRNLDFAIVCKSDYGSYSAKASIITTTPSSDGTFIRVEDAAGNKDRLGIRITDSANRVMKVDGSTAEQTSSINSQGPAEFTWKATLIPGSKSLPAGGTFTAKAEIVFDIK